MTIGPINTQTNYLAPEFSLPEDDAMMREIISRRERITATVVNAKENSQYEKRELITGQQWFNTTVSQATNVASTRQPRYAFRLTFDLVALNNGNIANGVTTTINLPTTPTAAGTGSPTCIQSANGLIPVHGFGAATAGTTYYFVNDPNLYVRFSNTNVTTQSVAVTNTTGSVITQMYWVFEYLKN